MSVELKDLAPQIEAGEREPTSEEETMKMQVLYDAPVSAFVDTETGEVDRVVVWCEGIQEREGDCAIVTAEHEPPVDDPDRERAQEIVDSVTWPAWDIA